jgi:hypothetical protein
MRHIAHLITREKSAAMSSPRFKFTIKRSRVHFELRYVNADETLLQFGGERTLCEEGATGWPLAGKD